MAEAITTLNDCLGFRFIYRGSCELDPPNDILGWLLYRFPR